MHDIHAVGPNLREVFDVLEHEGLDERGQLYGKEDGWSGDLYVIHKRLFKFQDEIGWFTGDSGAGGDKIANVYEVVMNNTEGWAQLLSLILKGKYDGRITKRLENLDFAPKHSYLAKSDHVANPYKRGLWIEKIMDFERLLPTIER